MNKLIKYTLDNNLVVNCRTEEDARELLRLAHESGLKWSNGVSYLRTTAYEKALEDTCYHLKYGTVDRIQFLKTKNVVIVEYQELKRKLKINKTTKKETVLEIEFVDVFYGYKAWRITKQNEEILKRGIFEDREFKVYSVISPRFSGGLYVRGRETSEDYRPNICTNQQAEIIKEKVRLINEKYGRPKFDAEEEYKKLKEVEFVYERDNYYATVDKCGKYNFSHTSLNKILGIKYISEEDAEEFCRRANSYK